jgi:hypothetical protein
LSNGTFRFLVTGKHVLSKQKVDDNGYHENERRVWSQLRDGLRREVVSHGCDLPVLLEIELPALDVFAVRTIMRRVSPSHKRENRNSKR